jgi:plastocyanin
MGIFKLRLCLLVLVASVLLAGCGGDDSGAADETSDGESTEVAVSAKDFEFSPKELKVPAGEVTVNFTNEGTVAHTFTLEEDPSVDTGSVQPGESKTITFTVPEEEADYICTIHYESKDMEGKISPE